MIGPARNMREKAAQADRAWKERQREAAKKLPGKGNVTEDNLAADRARQADAELGTGNVNLKHTETGFQP